MIEILILINLSKKIAAKARDKGYSGGGFVVLLLALWFGGEITGMFGAILLLGDGDENFFAAYLAALGGAVVGGILAFTIVGALSETQPDHEDYDDYEDPRVR
jgi:hypothetical protein